LNTVFAESREDSWFERFVRWREHHVSEHKFVLILSFVVGILAAIAAISLHAIINEIELLLTSSFNQHESNWLYLVYPVIGIYITSLFIRYIVKDDISHGVTRILYSISRRQSRLKAHNCWSSIIASAITIGFGGSVGAEAPIVLTGSAIGSNLGRLFRMDHKTMMLLVGCGAAGAVAGIFKAPIAGLVFTLEVLMIDLTMASLLPLLISCVTATGFTYIFTGTKALFTFHIDNAFIVERIPSCILLGIFCGLISLYFTRMMNSCENVFGRFKDHPYIKLIIGGSVLSALIFLFPSLYGEGYKEINLLLNGSTQAEWSQIMNNSLFSGRSHLLLVYLSLVLLLKVFASSATNGGGGCGGIFAPSLFLGSISGFVFARVWNIYQIGGYVPEKNYALLGMAGLMSGVMHAPLTGIFLIAELTGGYELFMPIMIVSVCAYLTIITFEPHSIYAMRLAKKGQLVTHHTDRAVLTLMSLDSVIDKTFDKITPDMYLGQVVTAIARSKRTKLPVVDAGGCLLGEIVISDIRNIIFRNELYRRFTVDQLMTPPSATLGVNDPMEDVMRKFDSTSADSLPVLDSENRLVGYITRQRMYGMYRKMVADLSEE
jgi:CIC family chloride channel protein